MQEMRGLSDNGDASKYIFDAMVEFVRQKLLSFLGAFLVSYIARNLQIVHAGGHPRQGPRSRTRWPA